MAVRGVLAVGVLCAATVLVWTAVLAEAAVPALGANVSAGYRVNASLLPGPADYGTLFTGDALLYERCVPPLLRVEGLLVFKVTVFNVNGSDVAPGERSAYNAVVAEAIARLLDGRSGPGWFALTVDIGSNAGFASNASLLVGITYGLSGTGVYWNTSLVSLYAVPLIAPMWCRLSNARAVKLDDTFYLVSVAVNCTGTLPPGKYMGTPSLFIDLHDYGVNCTRDDLGACVTSYDGYLALLTAFDVPYPVFGLVFGIAQLAAMQASSLVPGVGVGIGWLEYGGSVATQSFPLPVSILVPVSGLVLTPSGPEPILPTPGLVEVLQTETTAASQRIQPVTLVVPNVSCTGPLSYDIASGTVSPGGPGAPFVVPSAGLAPLNGSLPGVEVPTLQPTGVLPRPDLDTPAGVVAVVGLFALWMALASSLGLATGTMVAGVVAAVYGVLSGDGRLVVAGAIIIPLMLLYRYVTGSA